VHVVLVNRVCLRRGSARCQAARCCPLHSFDRFIDRYVVVCATTSRVGVSQVSYSVTCHRLWNARPRRTDIALSAGRSADSSESTQCWMIRRRCVHCLRVHPSIVVVRWRTTNPPVLSVHEERRSGLVESAGRSQADDPPCERAHKDADEDADASDTDEEVAPARSLT
jgi:hypothetical protein